MSKRPSKSVRMLMDEYKRRLGNRPNLFSDDMKRAILGQCAFCVLIERDHDETDPLVQDYFEALEILIPGEII